MKTDSPLLRILEMARWAPSGDNTQPWRFEIIGDMHFLIHITDTRDWCFYDLDGKPSQLATGAILENIAIAASAEQFNAKFKARESSPNTSNFVIEVTLEKDSDLKPHPLMHTIQKRVTQRRAFSGKPLTSIQKKSLEDSVGNDYRVIWMEGKKKWQMAVMVFRWAQIPFTIPEGYRVHKRIIAFGAQYSDNKIPDQAIGLDPLALSLMKWSMKSWERIRMLNRYFAGTLIPRIQLNLIPGICCAAHFLIASKNTLTTIDDYLNAGRALQRFWLTATQLNLQLQPEMVPLILSRYVQVSINFTLDAAALGLAKKFTAEFAETLGKDVDCRNNVFMGRIGLGKQPLSRSMRLTVEQLLH
jgi:hypothetical protein